MDFEVTVRKSGSKIQVRAPYSEYLWTRARALGGYYRKKSKMWSFSEQKALWVCALIADFGGMEQVPEWLSQSCGWKPSPRKRK